MTAPGVIGPAEMLGALICGAGNDAADAAADADKAGVGKAGFAEAGTVAPCGCGFTLGETGGLLEIEDFAVGEDDARLRCNAMPSIRPPAIRTIAEAIMVARRFVGEISAGLTSDASGMLARRCAAAAGGSACAP